MLLPADELLLHQTGRPLAHTSISDHRFYDRYWFTGLSADSELAFNIGMGLYKNMNVMDGFLAVMNGKKQHNLRVSRVLRPDVGTTKVGPLSVEIVEPFRHLRLCVAENEHGIACEIDWRSDYPVHLEAMHTNMANGMITQENTRYDQVGAATGWIMTDGKKIPVEKWWTVRDHSWGVRPGVGGFEPIRGDHGVAKPELPSDQIRLWLWSCFSTADYSAQMQRIEDRAGRMIHLDGEVLYRDGRSAKVKSYDHDIEFYAGTHAVKSLHYKIALSDGTTLDIQAEPAIRAWAYGGTGYDKGYNDGRGLGAQRGNLVPEYDVYDLSDPEVVRNAAGAAISAGHREQPVRLTVNGETALGHFPVMVWDTLPGMSDE